MQGNKKIHNRYGSEMDGYTVASMIDEQLNDLLELNPPSRENYQQWMKAARTIQTSCETIEYECKRVRELKE